MNFTNLAFKFNSILAGGISSLPSLVAADGDVVNTVEASSMSSAAFSLITDGLINLILRLIFAICRFVLNLIEFFQFVVSSILGISVKAEDYVVLDSKNPLVKLLTNESVLRVFKYMLGIAILLIIIFTIFAIVKSEYQFAVEGDPDVSGKGRIFARSLRSFFTLGMFPLMLLFGVIVINAILAGFNNILRNGENTTLASQIFISSAYNANNYRQYADNDMRVPILINFEDPIEMGRGNYYSPEELAKFYKDFQPTGESLYNNFADYNFSSFSDTVTYKHNKILNKSNYSGYEQFVCTREQYYVMADFIDYAVKNNLKYYVKNMTDVDINWKYVSDTIYDKDNQTLKISYKDASNLSGSDNYTVEYSPAINELSTPISDAIKTISALLAVGDYSDVEFNIMERLENSINVVDWHTDKVYLRFSEGFRNSLENKSTANMTTTDQLILFERARLKYNNDLNCSIDALMKEDGVLVPLHKIDKRVYQKSTSSFIVTDTVFVAEINGTYYEVKETPDLTSDSGLTLLRDEYNDPYYTLIESSYPLQQVVKTADDKFKLGETEVDPNFVVDLGRYNGTEIGYYFKNKDSFKDIICEVVSGSEDFDLENGDIHYAIYDDQVSKVIKQVSWPQKLINDLQVIYKDININQLLATNKWLTQLGEYVEAGDTTGDYTGNINTSIIHPLGLIMSELFLGKIAEADRTNSYGSLMFKSMFDEDTVKALVLSMLGEYNYYQLSAELNYFIEIFNVFMGPVLDDIAYYENFDLKDGDEASVQLYTYKAYLASVLLSSSAARWFHETALALIGYTNISQEILDDNGYYKPHSALTADQKTKINDVYNKAVEELKAKSITKLSKDYPEYLLVLEDYINGKLDNRVLQSFMSDEKRMALAENEYDTVLYVKYTELMDTLSEEDKEFLKAYIKEVSGSYTNDGNFNVPNISILKELNKLRSELMNKQQVEQEDGTKTEIDSVLDTYLNSKEDKSNNSNIKNKLTSYFNAVDSFVEAQTYYLTTDSAYANVGNLKKLEAQLFTQKVKAAAFLLDNDVKSFVDNETSLGNLDLVNVDEWRAFKNRFEEIRKLEVERGSNKDIIAYLGVVNECIHLKDSIDNLKRYYITYGIEQCTTQSEDIELKVVVNNKRYVVGQNFTKAKFIEYVLGAEFLNKKGYETVFVDDNYKGLIQLDEHSNLTGSFTTLTDFLVELGDISAVLSQMTNLVNLAEVSIDEVVIGETEENNISLSKYILAMLINEEHLPIDIIRAFFGIDDGGDDQVAEKAINSLGDKETDNARLNTVLSYLLLTDTNENNENYVDYNKLTLKELRKIALQFLIDYEDQQGDTAEQNQKRFLGVFALACSDWYTFDNPETMENEAEKLKEGESATKYTAVNNSWTNARKELITGLSSHKQSQATILRLAGLDNRPYEELVGAEYTIDFNVRGIDEANGDLFIICTFDEETKYFVPFMMANNSSAALKSDEDGNWLSTYGFSKPYTDYYSVDENGNSQYYPVIAKGVITADGIPTAIRENEGRIEYYRDNIVIHDASNYGLSSYFMTMDQIQVKHTSMSYITNMFSKMFTGKTLIEHLAGKIPKFTAHSDFNFCYGTQAEVLTSSINGYTAISFNFDESVCLPMSYFYELEEMNIIILIIGTVTIIGALWKAMWGVVGRMYDITLLFLLGPACISTIPLRADKNDKGNIVEMGDDDTYSRWKKTLMEKLLSVFAYAIGFNIFFVVVPIISDLTIFESNKAFANLPLFGNLSVAFLNEIGRVIFLIATAFLTTRAPQLFADISATSNGFDAGANVYKSVKGTVSEVVDRTSGAHAVDSLRKASQTAKSLIPGAAIASIASGSVKAVSDKLRVKNYKNKAMKQGVSEEVANKMASELQERINDKRQIKQAYQQKREAETNMREAQRSGNVDSEKMQSYRESIKATKGNIKKLRRKSKRRRSRR